MRLQCAGITANSPLSNANQEMGDPGNAEPQLGYSLCGVFLNRFQLRLPGFDGHVMTLN